MNGRRVVRGDIVLVGFPFTDLSGQKLRPALVAGRVMDSDVILGFISSRVVPRKPDAEVLVDPRDPEFGSTGLRVASLIRLAKLVTLHRRLLLRRLGKLGPRTQQAVDGALRYVFELPVAR